MDKWGETYSTDEILEYIKTFQEQHGGMSPTFLNIMEALDISSKSVVRFYLDRLKNAGKIEYLMSGGSKPRIRGIIVNQ